jgi:lysyl-tRNA synthetase class 2
MLRRRAELLAAIRAFFAARGVLEVETPTLSRATVTAPHLASLRCRYSGPGAEAIDLYLQTSPEYAMKRLLAAGSGPIYQICRAFRDGEAGRHHNPEFTLLEWYRPGYDHLALMDEIGELLADLGLDCPERITYCQIFERFLGVDPHAVSVDKLREKTRQTVSGPSPALAADDRDAWLDLLLVSTIGPELGKDRPTFVYDYPASQAALAAVRPGPPEVAERFELYIDGIEIANGWNELTDPGEQRARFERDLEQRRRAGSELPLIDKRLLAALDHGLPQCAGVALGIDRLLFAMTGEGEIGKVLAFPIDRA